MTTKITTLANGMKVVTDTFDAVETAALGVWVNVGSRYEPFNMHGISHLLEHMAFKGTVNYSALQLAEKIEAVGGHLNAYTSRETTAYYARVMSGDVPLATHLLSDILQFSVFAPEELAREKSVILQEIGQTQDTPDDLVFDHFQEVAYPKAPLGRSILGTSESVNNISRDMLMDYMKQHYTASNMIFAAAGKVDHDQLVNLVEESFTHIPHESHHEPAPSNYVGGDYRQHDSLEQIHCVLGFEGVPMGHEDYYACALLSTLFGGSMSSRLFQEVREKRGLAYAIYSFTSSYSDSGIFGVYAGTGEKEISELLPVVCDELLRLPNTITNEEIVRSKTQLKTGLMMALENTATRCEQLAQQMMVYGRPLSPVEIIDRIEAIEKQDIAQLAQAIFSTTPTLSAIGPIDCMNTYDDIASRLSSPKQRLAV